MLLQTEVHMSRAAVTAHIMHSWVGLCISQYGGTGSNELLLVLLLLLPLLTIHHACPTWHTGSALCAT
jgi:hypothetical protein